MQNSKLQHKYYDMLSCIYDQQMLTLLSSTLRMSILVYFVWICASVYQRLVQKEWQDMRMMLHNANKVNYHDDYSKTYKL